MIFSVASTPKSAVMSASSISPSVASSRLRPSEKSALRGVVKTSLVFASPFLNLSMNPPNSPMSSGLSPQRHDEHKGKDGYPSADMTDHRIYRLKLSPEQVLERLSSCRGLDPGGCPDDVRIADGSF